MLENKNNYKIAQNCLRLQRQSSDLNLSLIARKVILLAMYSTSHDIKLERNEMNDLLISVIVQGTQLMPDRSLITQVVLEGQIDEGVCA